MRNKLAKLMRKAIFGPRATRAAEDRVGKQEHENGKITYRYEKDTKEARYKHVKKVYKLLCPYEKGLARAQMRRLVGDNNV